MEYDHQIYKLSTDFFQKYPVTVFSELLHKQSRPYNCLLIDSHKDYLICVPFRTSINHKNAFLFKNSARSRNNRSGLDYSKIVIICDSSYLTSENAIIDKDEYNETIQNMDRIVREVLRYVDRYIMHVKSQVVLSTHEYDRLYKYSTLKYFHSEMGIVQ